MKTYAITTKTDTKFISASSRQNAVKKLFGVKEEVAIKMGVMTSIKLVKEA